MFSKEKPVDIITMTSAGVTSPSFYFLKFSDGTIINGLGYEMDPNIMSCLYAYCSTGQERLRVTHCSNTKEQHFSFIQSTRNEI